MDKEIPSFNLEEFKNSNFEITRTAQIISENIGFDKDGIQEVVSTIQSEHFYKSMTS